MPTADSYNYFCSLNTTTGLGAGGNGLPLFSDLLNTKKVDISAYAHSSVLTIEQLAPIYWNCYKVLCDVEIDAVPGQSAASVSEAEFDSSDAGYQPKNRRTNATPSASAQDGGAIGAPTARLSLSSFTSTVRLLYNGSTSDSSNFVGYGFVNLITARAFYIDAYGAENRDTQKIISSIFESEQSDDVANGITYNYSTVSISGVNFKQELKVQDYSSSGSGNNPTRSVGNITLDFFTY